MGKLDFGLFRFDEEAHFIVESMIILTSTTFAVFSIYQHRQKERSLQKLKQLKKTLNEAAIISSTDKNGKITFVNDKFVEISKYSRKELLE